MIRGFGYTLKKFAKSSTFANCNPKLLYSLLSKFVSSFVRVFFFYLGNYHFENNFEHQKQDLKYRNIAHQYFFLNTMTSQVRRSEESNQRDETILILIVSRLLLQETHGNSDEKPSVNYIG